MNQCSLSKADKNRQRSASCIKNLTKIVNSRSYIYSWCLLDESAASVIYSWVSLLLWWGFPVVYITRRKSSRRRVGHTSGAWMWWAFNVLTHFLTHWRVIHYIIFNKSLLHIIYTAKHGLQILLFWKFREPWLGHVTESTFTHNMYLKQDYIKFVRGNNTSYT